jgi:capsular exopolysaccharide synthesis family protein
MALAALVGLIGGLGFACVRDRYDYPLASARQIRSALGARVIGMIPRIAAGGRVLETDPTSDVAESCRALYHAICEGIPEDRARTLVVTSPARGDGKTTLAANLALAMAQQGKRVLLVDADFRSPSIQRIFDLRGKAGLGNVLQDEHFTETAIHGSCVSGLDVLPCGTVLGNPIEMLNSERFIAALEHLSSVYDHVVIDAPPTVPVDDARIIAASCDVTLLVLRAGRANRRLSETARDGLIAVGANILGIVVNDVQPRSYAQYEGVYEDGPVFRRAAGSSHAKDETVNVHLRNLLARRTTELGVRPEREPFVRVIEGEDEEQG